MVPFHIYFRVEGSRVLVPWKFHGKEFQMSNIEEDNSNVFQMLNLRKPMETLAAFKDLRGLNFYSSTFK
jgi:hypothetical protein